MAYGIARKLQAMRDDRAAQQRSASGRDRVPVKSALVDEELARLGLDLGARNTGSRRTVLSEAFAEGQAAGARFEALPLMARPRSVPRQTTIVGGPSGDAATR